MNIEHYEVFLKVVQLGSLTAAASQLGYTQSGVSHIINALENDFGFPLLARKKTGIALTADGEKLLVPMREVISRNELLREAAASVRGVIAGKVKVGTFSSLAVHWLPELLCAFMNEYPGIEIALSDGGYHAIENWIVSEEIDCGFITQQVDAQLVCHPLFEDRFCILMSREHRLSGHATLPLSAIADEPFIVPGEGAGYDLGRILAEAGIAPQVRFAVSDDYAVMAMVERGMGISILPALVLDGHTERLHVAEIESRPKRTIGIATRAKKVGSPASVAFVRFVRAWFAAQNACHAIG